MTDSYCMAHEVEAGAWIRWQRWLLRTRLRHRQVLVLQMDETSVLSPVEKRRGFFVRKQDLRKPAKQFQRLGQRRCTLIAVICNDATLQQHLPQVLLPRNIMKRVPGSRLQNIYAAMGAPLEAWHGTSGSVDGDVMKMWLREISGCVRKHRPDMDIVLTMDCCPVHKSEEILQTARKLDIHVAVVPARCTWFLQTLDVKVFHHLKRLLRSRLMAAEAADTTGVLQWQQHVDAIADSVHEVLVNKSWAKEMADMGMGMDNPPPTSNLGKLLAGEDLAARPPSNEELTQLLGGKTTSTQKDWVSLFGLNEPEGNVIGREAHTPGEPASSKDCVPSAEISATASTSPTTTESTAPHHAQATSPRGVLRLTSRHRLQPAVNATLTVEPPERVGPSSGTRSQRCNQQKQ